MSRWKLSVGGVDVSVSPEDKTRRFYDVTADSYDSLMEQEIQIPLYDRVLGALARAVEAVPGVILDSSCGSGHMLQRIADKYCPGRELVGVDLSPEMVRISRNRLGDSAEILEGNMSSLPQIPDSSSAAVISFFAIHHVDESGLRKCIGEWRRVLATGGQLFLAAWEGSGDVDYGDASDVVARRYTEEELTNVVSWANMRLSRASVEPVEGMDMDVVHVTAVKPSV